MPVSPWRLSGWFLHYKNDEQCAGQDKQIGGCLAAQGISCFYCFLPCFSRVIRIRCITFLLGVSSVIRIRCITFFPFGINSGIPSQYYLGYLIREFLIAVLPKIVPISIPKVSNRDKSFLPGLCNMILFSFFFRLYHNSFTLSLNKSVTQFYPFCTNDTFFCTKGT
jgi:hypothetical protein